MEYHNMSIDELARQAEVDDNKLALQILADLEEASDIEIEEAVSEALQPLEEGIQRVIGNLEDILEDPDDDKAYENMTNVISDLEGVL